MKTIYTILFLILNNYSSAQIKPSEYIEVSFSLPWKTVKISLTKASKIIYSTTSDTSIIFIYQDLEPGYYKLTTTNTNNIEEYRDSILVKAGEKITANIMLDSTCYFVYPKNYIPICPVGHKNKIVEIRYRNEINILKGKKYYLVTYSATGCIPRYFCIEHHLKF